MIIVWFLAILGKMLSPHELITRSGRTVSAAAGVLMLTAVLSGCSEYNESGFTPGASAQPPAAAAEGSCLTGVDYIGDRSRTMTDFGKALAKLAAAGANGEPMEDSQVEFVLACGNDWGKFSSALGEMRGAPNDRNSHNAVCANNFYPPNVEILQGKTYADEHTTRDIRNRLATGGDAGTLCEAQAERAMEADKTSFWVAVPADHSLWRATGTQPAP